MSSNPLTKLIMIVVWYSKINKAKKIEKRTILPEIKSTIDFKIFINLFISYVIKLTICPSLKE